MDIRRPGQDNTDAAAAAEPAALCRDPHLARVVQQNINILLAKRAQALEARNTEERLADQITRFSGSMLFVYIHAIWFLLWFILNSGWFNQPFDPFPYGLLTMIVSLEAIFLATFVLISQNRMSKTSERRTDLDLHINLLAEHEITRILEMVHRIADHIGLKYEHNGELQELEQDVAPEQVLEELEVLEKRRRVAPDVNLRGGERSSEKFDQP